MTTLESACLQWENQDKISLLPTSVESDQLAGQAGQTLAAVIRNYNIILYSHAPSLRQVYPRFNREYHAWLQD